MSPELDIVCVNLFHMLEKLHIEMSNWKSHGINNSNHKSCTWIGGTRLCKTFEIWLSNALIASKYIWMRSLSTQSSEFIRFITRMTILLTISFCDAYRCLYDIGMQIASFIKTHIFSRRRPIDGWKYMIEELGPNARKIKGSVSRLPSLSDASTQPFKEEKTPMSSSSLPPYKER